MSVKHYVSCLWPGLPELWWRGQLAAVPAALAFALALNLVLVTRYVYPMWLPTPISAMGSGLFLVTWVALIVRGVRELPQWITPRAVADQPDRFSEAQIAYLKADYETAECLLQETLAVEHRDPPALLLLCGVYRLTDRLDEAELLLQEASRIDASTGWQIELIGEAKRLKRRMNASKSEGSSAADLAA